MAVTSFDCAHESWSGDEGPAALLGRSPHRWRCDGCDAVFYTCRACHCSAEAHDPLCHHGCSGWFAEDPPGAADAAVAFADMLRNGQTAERVLRLIVGWVEHTS